MVGGGAHFVLVHGLGHGAWCWFRVVAILKSAGCRATAIDLAASGINTKRLDEIPLFSDYVEPLMAFLEGLPTDEKVILVGHSFGGLSIAAAMEKFPTKISAGVFVTAYMPGPELSLQEMRQHGGSVEEVDNEYEFGEGPENEPTAILLGPKCMSIIYESCPPEDFALASVLTRTSPLYNNPKSYEETLVFTKKNFGSVYRVYVVVLQDVAIPASEQRWMIEKNPPNDVKEVSGSDHMVMCSKPQELCSHFLAIADKLNS